MVPGMITEYLDLGSYSPEKAETVSLDKPSTLPGLEDATLVTELGAGVVRGDVGNPKLAPLHSESQRLADVLNRLGLNGMDDAPMATAEIDGKTATTPEGLIEALMATGHSVVVADGRYFANFGHFHFKGQDVMMPFFIDSQIGIPGTKRSLMSPVSHAEYEWVIRGPKVNANVSWYFGIDGKSEFRTMDTLDQAWVLGRHAHEYRGADAVEVTRLVGKMVVAFMHQHLRRPDLPFGGYYSLGVCQDGVAAIEKKMTGHDTLFPNTADGALFDDPRDAEVNAMMLAIPKDRNGAPPAPERIFGSIPTTNFREVTIPGMATDLETVYAAWKDGSLERTRSWVEMMILRGVVVVALLVLAGSGDLETAAGEERWDELLMRDATRGRDGVLLAEGGSIMATKKASAKKSARKYGTTVGKDVEREMKAMKQGKLKSGRSGKTVTNPKQAIAIGLSEARKEGKKVPPPKG